MCLAVYIVLMAFNYWIETYKEQGAFFISTSHEMAKFKNWQKMQFASEVIISDDNLSADYEIQIDATGTGDKVKNKAVSVKYRYPVTKVFDNKGYFHIRKASDLIIDDIFDRLLKEINKTA